MILVTGGAGFIGSNIVAALCTAGRAVAVCDLPPEGDKARNLDKRALAALVTPEELDRFLEHEAAAVTAVIHMGAISSTTERDIALLVETNIVLSKRLWTFAAARGLPFIYASSAATYGDGAEGFDDDAAPAALARLWPLNGYGWSKLLFDRWAVAQGTAGAPCPPSWAGLRFFNVYGPNEYHKGGQASVAWHLYNQVMRGEPARLFKSHHPDYADGGQLRDFIWVGDCVEVVLWLLDRPGLSGFFNVGTGRARSFADLAGAVFAALGRNPAIDYIATPQAIRDKYQYFTQARMERLAAAGYDKPFTTLEAGVASYIREHLSRNDPYR